MSSHHIRIGLYSSMEAISNPHIMWLLIGIYLR